MNQYVVDEILTFWFADIGNGFEIGEQNRLWYGGGLGFDQQIDNQFGELVRQALDGKLSALSATAEGALALIILLDQFPRNIYRASSEAFSGDQRARDIVNTGLECQLHTQLTFIQRTFFYMPLEHSESLADQQRCVTLFEQLLDDVPLQGKKVIESTLRFAVHHREIIERFGRFPHRNKVLGRQSTQEELDYLQTGGARFGQ